jgi:hypothetical protein
VEILRAVLTDHGAYVPRRKSRGHLEGEDGLREWTSRAFAPVGPAFLQVTLRRVATTSQTEELERRGRAARRRIEWIPPRRT